MQRIGFRKGAGFFYDNRNKYGFRKAEDGLRTVALWDSPFPFASYTPAFFGDFPAALTEAGAYHMI